MKRTHDSKAMLRLIVQASLVVAMVAVFLVPTSVKVNGTEAGIARPGYLISKPSLTESLFLFSPEGLRQTFTYRRAADGFTVESLLAPDSQLPTEPSELRHSPLELPINADRG